VIDRGKDRILNHGIIRATLIMLNSEEIEKVLYQLGFKCHINNVRIHGFKREDIEFPLFVKTPANGQVSPVKKNPLVVHPNIYSLSLGWQGYVVGVEIFKDKFLHNSNLDGFPERVNKKGLISYGLSACVESGESLRSFVRFIADKTTKNNINLSESEDLKNAEGEFEEVDETIKKTLIDARRGQGKYRAQLVEYWTECSVTGVKVIELLRASHIKPWRDSTNSERLDCYNGLLLNPNLDAAFDRGFISFSDNGGIIISEGLKAEAELLSISGDMELKKVDVEHMKYLKWHRENIFKGDN
jgi:putative restriction endonuclease